MTQARRLCRQLGLKLVGLRPELPLFCGVTGARISEEQDKRIEVLRDALMDAARSRVEELGEDAVAGWGAHSTDMHREAHSCSKQALLKKGFALTDEQLMH